MPGYDPTPNTFITCALVATPAQFGIAMASAAVPGFTCRYQSAQTPSLSCF
jgi:hypothetical protein